MIAGKLKLKIFSLTDLQVILNASFFIQLLWRHFHNTTDIEYRIQHL